MEHDWLTRFLHEAPQKYRCMTLGCTTCGALPFREGVLKALAEATGEPADSYQAPRVAAAITSALAVLSSRDLRMRGVGLVLYDLAGHRRLDPALRALLDGTPAGALLLSMDKHQAERRARAAEWAVHNGPEAVAERRAARREERRRLKQPEIEARAARKVERDRLWRLRRVPES